MPIPTQSYGETSTVLVAHFADLGPRQIEATMSADVGHVWANWACKRKVAQVAVLEGCSANLAYSFRH